MALGLHRYSVRYDYTVKDGFEALPGGKRQQKYKTNTATRTVECKNAKADAKELAAILTNSHRREEPTDLKVLAFNRVDEAPSSQLTGHQEALISNLQNQVIDLIRGVGEQDTRIAALELKVSLLESTLNDLMGSINSGPEKATEKPKASAKQS